MTTAPAQLDFLFVCDRSLWPADQGFCVHGAQMALALRRLGMRVGVASIVPPPDDAPANLQALHIDWPASGADESLLLRGWSGALGGLRRRLARYLAPSTRQLAGVIGLARRYRPTVIVGLGLVSPLMLRAIQHLRDDGILPPVTCIWYAADEMVYHHLSCLSHERGGAARHRVWQLVQHAALERLFAAGLDAAIGVSPRDSTLLRGIAGVRRTATIRNGVDLHAFQSATARPAAFKLMTGCPRENDRSPDVSVGLTKQDWDRAAGPLIFWGRLDFAPNIDAVCWFAREVWPRIHSARPNAQWWIVGKNASPRVLELAGVSGIRLLGEVADIRPYAHAASAVVLPMRCGGGIKNKLLEAAAMGKPIIASPKAVDGLDYDSINPPFVICRTSDEWRASVRRVLADAAMAETLAQRCRRWVQMRHDWIDAAQQLIAFVNSLPTSTFKLAQPQCDNLCPPAAQTEQRRSAA